MMDVHRFEKTYHTCTTRIWKSSICQEDKEGIETFLKEKRAKSTGYARLIKLAHTLLKIAKTLQKPIDKATESDIQKLVGHFENQPYSFWTKHDIRVILKQYYSWLNAGVYPKKVAWINTTIPKKVKSIVNHGELLTVGDVLSLIENTDNPRNKALISVLAESGARVGEIGNLTIRQVDIDNNGIVLNLNGKTGYRRIRLVTSTPFLINWLNFHPDKNNSSSPLWVNTGAYNHHKSLSYEGIRKIIRLTFMKAGIHKRANPHIFRHSRACQLAHKFTEFQMNAYFGWVQGSNMPAIYIHISGKDLDEHILRMNGLETQETQKNKIVEHRRCPRCETINSVTALYCGKCAEIIDPSLELKTQIETNNSNPKAKTPFLEWLQQDPEMKNILHKKTQEFKQLGVAGLNVLH